MKNEAEIETFIKTTVQMEKFLEEFTALSKKAPNDAVNMFKLNLINPVLQTMNEILDEKNKPFSDFREFRQEDLPSNSDTVIILSQYLACMERFRRENTEHAGSDYWWVIDGKISKIKAPNPHYSILSET